MSIYADSNWLRELTDTQAHRREMAASKPGMTYEEMEAEHIRAMQSRSRLAHPSSAPKLTVVEGGVS